jgi:hypothetical protein
MADSPINRDQSLCGIILEAVERLLCLFNADQCGGIIRMINEFTDLAKHGNQNRREARVCWNRAGGTAQDQ